MDLATTCVSHHCTGLKDMSEAFSSKQDALYKDSTRHTEDLRNELNQRLLFFQKESQTSINKANASINTKAEAMESVSSICSSTSSSSSGNNNRLINFI